MKRTRYVIYFILFLAVLSCDSQFIDEENKLQQENIEALTKSVPVVCVDLYVRWDDTDISNAFSWDKNSEELWVWSQGL